MAPEPEGPTVSPIDEVKIRAQLRRWQERLLDLTKANPLLGINRSRLASYGSPNRLPRFFFVASSVARANLGFPLSEESVGPPRPSLELRILSKRPPIQSNLGTSSLKPPHSNFSAVYVASLTMPGRQ